MKRKTKKNQGQAVMEYVILSSLIGIFCLIAVKDYGDVIKKRITNMKKHVAQKVTLYDVE